jgi:hypothetical protein
MESDMRALTIEELGFVSGGMYQPPEVDGGGGGRQNPFVSGPPTLLDIGNSEVVIVFAFRPPGDSNGDGRMTAREHVACVAQGLNNVQTLAAIGGGALQGGRFAATAMGVTSLTPYGGYAIAAGVLVGAGAGLVGAAMSASVGCRFGIF